MTVKVPQLVCPAGMGLDRVYAAVDNGADAVYLGMKLGPAPDRMVSETSARGEIACFLPRDVEKAFLYCTTHNVQLIVALNNLLSSRNFEIACRHVEYLYEIGIRAIIAADVGFMKWVRHEYPDMRVHVSILGGTANRHSADLYRDLGASRVILENNLTPRDLSLLRAATPLELEVFLYGLTCLSFHSFCFLSACTHGTTCQAECTRKVEWNLGRGNRLKGAWLRARDLDLLKFIPTLAKIGIDAVKVEGRMRSRRYVATITAAARHILDNVRDGRGDEPLPPRLARKLASLPLFGTTAGYFHGPHPERSAICSDTGNVRNRIFDMLGNARFAAYLVRSRWQSRRLPHHEGLAGAHTACERRYETGYKESQRKTIGHSQLEPSTTNHPTSPLGFQRASRPSTPRRVIAVTPLSMPLIPQGADAVFVGEKHCALRFLDRAHELPGLLERIRDTGALPGIVVPGRLPESLFEQVLDKVMELKGTAVGAECYDPGMAKVLAPHFEVTIASAIHGNQSAQALLQAVGAKRLRLLHYPLVRYCREGFPSVDLDVQVFGHLTVSGGVYCLTRRHKECPARTAAPARITHPHTELLVWGNTLYSARVATAHLARSRLLDLPLAGLIIETFNQPLDLVESVIQFWKEKGDWPDTGSIPLSNGIYISDLQAPPDQRVPWDAYFPDLETLL